MTFGDATNNIKNWNYSAGAMKLTEDMRKVILPVLERELEVKHEAIRRVHDREKRLEGEIEEARKADDIDRLARLTHYVQEAKRIKQSLTKIGEISHEDGGEQ